MSLDASSVSAFPVVEPLPVGERRVLGVLVEKQKTSKTADSYPLTLNALTSGCNQKSNRDPVMDLTDGDLEEIITGLQKKGLVMRMTGTRVDRFRHLLYEAWKVTKFELAVLAELLLRGPQTKGELRGRASRMDPIDTLEVLDEILKPLVDRRLVVYLTDPERRGAVLSHGFHDAGELAGLKARQANMPVHSGETDLGVSRPSFPTASSDTIARLEAGLVAAMDEIAKLKDAVAALEVRVAELRPS